MADESFQGRKPRLVVVGGGFAGLFCVRALARENVDITLIDRRNFHLFQPLLYQVAAGGLSPANIAAPLRSILHSQRNVRTLLGEVTGFDIPNRQVILKDGLRLDYDHLLVATGSTHHYFGHPEWEAFAPGLKTVEDATEIRRRVLLAFEKAELTADAKQRERLLTFVVVGGGPTGVEMAGTLRELAKDTLRGDFRHIHPADAQIILIEGQPRILSAYVEKLSAKAQKSLEEMGVRLILDSHVTHVCGDHILYADDATHTTKRIDTECIVWAAGVKASPLGGILAEATGAAVGRGGHIRVEADCSLPGHPDIFVAGDMASLNGKDGKSLPGVAPVAMQQGRYISEVLKRRWERRTSPGPFQYRDKGSMATIGRRRAIADLGYIRLTGFPAWVAWLAIHIVYLAQFSNRILVIFQWGWNYLTRNRSARLITHAEAKRNA